MKIKLMRATYVYESASLRKIPNLNHEESFSGDIQSIYRDYWKEGKKPFSDDIAHITAAKCSNFGLDEMILIRSINRDGYTDMYYYWWEITKN